MPIIEALRQRSQFLATAASGKKWVAPGLILQIAKRQIHDPISPLRYGLTASSKVGNAVVRNRARRRLRALAQEILPLHALLGHDYVLIARQTTIKRSYMALQQDLITALKKLKAWRD